MTKEGVEQRVGSSGRRLHGAVAQVLGRSILSGDHSCGDFLPPELISAETLGISRGAYREGVQVLIAKGLVESRPKSGTRVLPRDCWNILDPEVLAWAFAQAPDMRLLRSLFELRNTVEPASASLAAERRDRHDLKRMKDALGVVRRETLLKEAGRAAHLDFHDAIIKASRNDAFIALSAATAIAIDWSVRIEQRSHLLPRDTAPDHVRIYDAIAAADREAARSAMDDLIAHSTTDVRAALGKSGV